MACAHSLATAHHQQTDGQTERMIQTIKTYLRHYTNSNQTNWIDKIPMAQLAINNRQSATTKQVPYEANHGRLPRLNANNDQWKAQARCEEATTRIAYLEKIWDDCKRRIAEVAEETTIRENKKRREGPQLKEGDKVYIDAKNFKRKGRSKTFEPKKVGPFAISKVMSNDNYELSLPANAKRHPEFHISLLHKAHPDTPLQETFHYEPEEEDTFEVEAILKQQGNQYLVKWKGYPDSENTWHYEKDLTSCQELIEEFHRKEHPA
ncbi:MAG TPA: chromo domain-containing protein, partial [Candidatus Caenarcaniphilales bacterium]